MPNQDMVELVFPVPLSGITENMPKNRLKMRKFQHCFSEIHCI